MGKTIRIDPDMSDDDIARVEFDRRAIRSNARATRKIESGNDEFWAYVPSLMMPTQDQAGE